VPACCPVVVIFLIAFRAIAAHLLAVVRVIFTDFDWFPFLVAAVEPLRYWSVNFDIFIRVFS
jgi:hypothetical protein